MSRATPHQTPPEPPPPAKARVRPERTFAVDSMSRVEGEGRLRVVVRGDEVVSAELSIFEAPRFFERLVVGRHPDEVLDMVARICGICPVAYQMTAVEAFERLFEVELDPQVRQLRRLFYWGEWLQSHALHIYLLHAPDFLGYDSALDMARDHRRIVERGLALKQAGVDLMKLIGGRAVHPVALRVGGFYPGAEPRTGARHAARPGAGPGRRAGDGPLDGRLRAARLRARPAHALAVRPRWLRAGHGSAHHHRGHRPSTRAAGTPSSRSTTWSTPRRCRPRASTGGTTSWGPSARIVLAGDALHPLAAGSPGGGRRRGGHPPQHVRARSPPAGSRWSTPSPSRWPSSEAGSRRPRPGRPGNPGRAWPPGPRRRRAACSSTATRWTSAGHVTKARIVPPTSQNQVSMEDDLRGFVAGVSTCPSSRRQRGWRRSSAATTPASAVPRTSCSWRSSGGSVASPRRMSRRVVVLACGDELRGDDGVARSQSVHSRRRWWQARRCASCAPWRSRTSWRCRRTRGSSSWTRWWGRPRAARGGDPRRPASGAARLSAASSHQLPLPEVVALAGLLRDAPLAGRFVGVGIESVAFGRPLSEPVAAAVPRLTDAIARAIQALGGRDTLPP